MTDEPEHSRGLFGRLSDALLRNPHSRDELISIIGEAKDRAIIDADTHEMIEGVLRVNEMSVDDVMVPRPQMVMIEAEMNVADAIPVITQSAHSRFPVIDTGEDKILGILLAKDLLLYTDIKQANTKVVDFIRPATFIPETKRLNVLLKEFRLQHNHMAVVVDEYGNIAGLITIEDVLEQIVGDIEDEYDIEDTQEVMIKQIDVDIAEVNALTPVDEFNAYFDKQLDEETFDTIGGMVLQAFSHLPKTGETIEIEDLEITVLTASNRGIQSLRIYRNPPKET